MMRLPRWHQNTLASPKLSCLMTYVFPFPVILIFLPLWPVLFNSHVLCVDFPVPYDPMSLPCDVCSASGSFPCPLNCIAIPQLHVPDCKSPLLTCFAQWKVVFGVVHAQNWGVVRGRGPALWRGALVQGAVLSLPGGEKG